MWNILGRELTPYAVSVWLGCIAAAAVFLWQGKRAKLKPVTLWCAVFLGIFLGLRGARLYYVLARWELFAESGLGGFFFAGEEERIWGAASGAGFWGAVGGAALAALLTGKITGEKTSAILDALAPSAALGIAISRFGEYSIGEGIGPEVEADALHFFPLAVMNEWEEWYFALFMLEGLAGLIIFVLLMTKGSRLRDGYRARMFLLLYAACQIVLEALRRDSYLRWLFVRVSQIASALVLLGLVIFGVIRWTRKPAARRMPSKKLILNLVFFALMVPIIILMEFDADKGWLRISMGLDYLVEAICCVVMGLTTRNIAMKN